jgi:SsrA-binding protein
VKVLAKNKRATYDYEITEVITAGVVLSGNEVKSAKAGHASLKGTFVTLNGGEAFLNNAHINPYQNAAAGSANEPTRARKLLLHRKQLETLAGQHAAGLRAVPISLITSRKLIKVEIGIGRPKKRYDKRAVIKQRDQEREARRAVS